MRSDKTKVYTIPQAMHIVDSLLNRSKRLLAYRSSETSKIFRKLITTCNSLVIVLLQFDLHEPSLKLLKCAISTDAQMYFEGNPSDKKWYQRPLIYSNLGYMVQRLGDYQSSLKFLRDAQSLIQRMNQAEAKDLVLAHSMLCFLVMFKLHKYERAEGYINIVSNEYRSIVNKERPSRFSSLACDNLFCLITLGVEVLKEAKDCLLYTSDAADE